jgi:metal-responsive CopG/Arc/MetJ family transcriptional regulator
MGNMKTIAITIDEGTLARVDRLTSRGIHAASRSGVIRQAVHQYVERIERAAADEQEAAIVRRHRSRLARQAQALVKVQAKP